jgi:hypothetical protein
MTRPLTIRPHHWSAMLGGMRTARDLLHTRETVDWWARVAAAANDNRGPREALEIIGKGA